MSFIQAIQEFAIAIPLIPVVNVPGDTLIDIVLIAVLSNCNGQTSHNNWWYNIWVDGIVIDYFNSSGELPEWYIIDWYCANCSYVKLQRPYFAK